MGLGPGGGRRRNRIARTVAVAHVPPRAVAIPRRSSSRAIARKPRPSAFRLSMMGRTAPAKRAALARSFTAAKALAMVASGLPSLVPRALAAASANLVRWLIASRPQLRE